MLMSYIQFDTERCSGCGICVDMCPSYALGMVDKSPQVSHTGLCISCGHCAALCPESAISSSESNSRVPFDLTDIATSLPPEHLLFHQKRSYRKFTKKELDKDTIQTMIQYAEMAPSSHNFRKREYIVVTDAEEIKRIEEIVVKVYRPLAKILNPPVLKTIRLLSKPAAQQTEEFAHTFKNIIAKYKAGEFPVFKNAPCVVMIAAPKNYDQSRDDCVAAQNYMMLYAQSLGIGSCISGYDQYAHKKLARYLKVSRDKQIFAISFFGYPREHYLKTIRYREPPITWISK
jgi:nitroreductase/NAD-dependent dihydropyrimidine dehydrogenase PreA subunit